MHEDLGLVVDHVDCSVFLSHLKLEDTVERLSSRHLALSLCLEDVKAQCDSLTPQTRERLQGILSQREVDISTHVSLAHAHGYLKISRNPLLRVHRDIPVRSETIHEPETDPFSGPADPSDSVTGELDFDSSVSKTRKCRRLLHKSPESAGGEGLRASFWNGGYDLTTRRGRERLYVFCSAKRPRHIWFSSPCRVPGTSPQRVSRILQGIADVFPRVQALGCHVHFSQPLSSASWNQKFLLDMTEKTLKAVVNGCAWGLRDSQGSLLNESWQILTTSPEVQRVLNHRSCDQRHKKRQTS